MWVLFISECESEGSQEWICDFFRAASMKGQLLPLKKMNVEMSAATLPKAYLISFATKTRHLKLFLLSLED
jgi:hypothetical protein